MRRQSWVEAQRYWETHAQRDGALDLDADPDALGNVCWPGQPTWLNAHLGRLQETAYDRLLGRLPAPAPGTRVLDVGCGSARWSRRLGARGYDVVGIDLQATLIEANRRRFPHLRFEQTSLQDFRDEQPFDLVSSVTVIQHNPFEQQAVMVGRLRELVRDGGHALVLENIHDQNHYVFARAIDGWRELFEASGFRLLEHQPYDYSPALRAVLAAREALLRRPPPGAAGPPDGGADAAGRGAYAALRHAQQLAMRAAITIDAPLERRLIDRAPRRLGAIHCGFLFRAT